MALAAAFARIRKSSNAAGRECVLCRQLIPTDRYRQHIDECEAPIDPDDCCIVGESSSSSDRLVLASMRKRRHEKIRFVTGLGLGLYWYLCIDLNLGLYLCLALAEFVRYVYYNKIDLGLAIS